MESYKKVKKLRLSVDLLEMKLRQSNVNKMEDVQYATLEPNGQIGFELKENKKPATKDDINMMLQEIQQLKQSMGLIPLALICCKTNLQHRIRPYLLV